MTFYRLRGILTLALFVKSVSLVSSGPGHGEFSVLEMLSYMVDYASLCVLSYGRTEALVESLISLKRSLDFPAEVIVVDDGTQDEGHLAYLGELYLTGQISKLLLNRSNEGVGEAVRMAFGAATGRYLFKLDADLAYTKGWLSKGVDVLLDPTIGMVGFFKYHADHPTVRFDRTNPIIAETQTGIPILQVDDFVSSAFGVHADLWFDMGHRWETHSTAFAEDVAFKTLLKKNGLRLALTVDDLIENKGFGLGRSTVVEEDENGKPRVHQIDTQPVLFGV